MLVLNFKTGVATKKYETRVFCHPLLEGKKRVKRRERPEVKKTPPFLHFLGGLKNGQEVVSTFLGPYISCFKICKVPYV